MIEDKYKDIIFLYLSYEVNMSVKIKENEELLF